MEHKRIGIPELKRYLNKDVPRLVRIDLLKHRIIREPDLECCVYHHLRNYLLNDNRWQIFAERRAKRTGRFIDLLIYRDFKPIIAIELKINRLTIGKKDLHSLRTSLKRLKVAKAYFIVANTKENCKYQPKIKTMQEKRYFKEIYIDHGLTGDQYKYWKDEQKMYAGQMELRNVKR